MTTINYPSNLVYGITNKTVNLIRSAPVLRDNFENKGIKYHSHLLSTRDTTKATFVVE